MSRRIARRKLLNCALSARCRRLSADSSAISAAFTLPASCNCWLPISRICSTSASTRSSRLRGQLRDTEPRARGAGSASLRHGSRSCRHGTPGRAPYRAPGWRSAGFPCCSCPLRPACGSDPAAVRESGCACRTRRPQINPSTTTTVNDAGVDTAANTLRHSASRAGAIAWRGAGSGGGAGGFCSGSIVARMTAVEEKREAKFTLRSAPGTCASAPSRAAARTSAQTPHDALVARRRDRELGQSQARSALGDVGMRDEQRSAPQELLPTRAEHGPQVVECLAAQHVTACSPPASQRSMSRRVGRGTNAPIALRRSSLCAAHVEAPQPAARARLRRDRSARACRAPAAARAHASRASLSAPSAGTTMAPP